MNTIVNLDSARGCEAYLLPVGFDVSADAYCRFMGRYSEPWQPSLLSWQYSVPARRALEVGCGLVR